MKPEHARVLHLIKGLGRGGAERLVVDQVALSRDARWEYEVAYLLPWKDALVPELERAGATVHCLGVHRESDVRWARALRRLVRERGIDIVHMHSPYVAVIARLALRRARPNLQIVYTLHNRAQSQRRITRLLDGLTLRFDDMDWAVSENVRGSLPRRLRARFEVVRHGVDVQTLRPAPRARREVRTALGLDHDDLVVTTVANLRRTKDLGTLLRAAKTVVDTEPHAQFLLVGEGPLDDELRDLHAELGLGERLQLLGSRDDIPRLLAASDAFVLSSRHEGLPVSMMEALVLGLPVVATAVGGVPELVTDGVEGRLVPPGRPGALADALLDVLGDAPTRAVMATAAAARGRGLDARRAVTTIEGRYELLVRGHR